MIRIADLPIDWQSDRQDFVSDFVRDCDNTPVIRLNFSDKLQSCHSVQYADCSSEHFLRGRSGEILLANSDWSEATSFFLPESDRDFALPLAALCSRFSYYNALLVHASLVKYHNKGVIFTGYSGVGKTTQAELWAKFLGAQIVNGDKVFVRETDGIFNAYGLPWKGSSEYCVNTEAQLSAVVVLRQSDTNRITQLKTEAAEYFMPHIFFPHWDKACLGNSLDVFDNLLKSTPVWLLECRPDEDAVKLTCNTIFG